MKPSVRSTRRGVRFSETVARAFRDGAPVVALESTIVTHGLPRPENLQAALDFESTVAEWGATPATIAMLDGVAHIGLESDELYRLASTENALKLSARDLPVAAAQEATGGTTVAATALLASRAGIRVFATGGIGGVHRNAGVTFDESADLGILGTCRITVVCAGVKSILDVGATLERLETLGVTVIVFGTNHAGCVHGKDITPFLLDYIHHHSNGASVAINLQIVRGNCKLGADIARAWSDLQAGAQTFTSH